MPASVPATSLPPGTCVVIASRDHFFARSLQSSLEARGADVHLWERMSPTLDCVKLEGVDVLLIETHGLGEADASLIERVRERSPLIEIVAISEDPLVESAVQALRSGVYTLLAYPVSDTQLAVAIREATLRKRRGEQRIKALEAPSDREVLRRPS